MKVEINKSQNKVYFKTGVYTANWIYLNRPDTQYNEDGVYSLTLKVPQDDENAAEMIREINALRAQIKGKGNAKDRAPLEADQNGFYNIKIKMKAKLSDRNTGAIITQTPKVYDADVNPWDLSKTIFSGAQVRVKFYAQIMEKKSVSSVGYVLQGVQVIENGTPRNDFGKFERVSKDSADEDQHKDIDF